MENLKLTRIDFRLIHGQVMTRWVKKYSISNIVVIDDKSAKSPILKKILLNAAPANVKVEIETVESAAKRWKENAFPEGNLLILFKDPANAEAAWKAGINYPSLQVGGIEGSAAKKNICRNIVMSKEDVEHLKPMYDAGVKVFCQPIPDDAEVSLKIALDKFNEA